MTALLALEPRDAGASVIEPDIEFDSKLDALSTRTKCHGCCVNASHQIGITGTLALKAACKVLPGTHLSARQAERAGQD